MKNPIDPNYKIRVQESFKLQTVMATLSAELILVEAGKVQIQLPFNDTLTQQNGFLHAGIVTTIVDSACGYAAYTLMPADSQVLTVEFKTNFLAPASGDYFIATGQVIRSGRTLTVCQGDVVAYTGDTEKQIALMQATLIALKSD